MSNQQRLHLRRSGFACLFSCFFVPILWTHVSDLPLVAGRFSYAFATVVAANAGVHRGKPGSADMAQADKLVASRQPKRPDAIFDFRIAYRGCTLRHDAGAKHPH